MTPMTTLKESKASALEKERLHGNKVLWSYETKMVSLAFRHHKPNTPTPTHDGGSIIL